MLKALLKAIQGRAIEAVLRTSVSRSVASLDESASTAVAAVAAVAAHSTTVVLAACRRDVAASAAGADLADLYVTSARDGLTDAQLADQPTAGGLFRLRPGVAGLPSHPFVD